MFKVIKLETLGLILTTSSLVVAFIYFDLIKKLDACTLCVLDRYLIAFIGIIFCPVTILFIWTIWSGPVSNSKTDIIEDIRP